MTAVLVVDRVVGSLRRLEMQKREALGREVFHQELVRHIERQAFFLDSDKEKTNSRAVPFSSRQPHLITKIVDFDMFVKFAAEL